MSKTPHLKQTATLLGLSPKALDPESLEVLAAVRAGAELAHTLTDNQSKARLSEIVGRWCAIVAPGSERRVGKLLAETTAQRDATWLRETLASRMGEDTSLPIRILTGLLVLLPPGYSSLRDGYAYIASAAEALLWGEELPRLLAWLERSGDTAVMAELDEIVADLAVPTTEAGSFMKSVVEAHGAWRREADARDDAGEFGLMRTRVLRALDELDQPARELVVGEQPRRDLRQYLEGEHFRVAVLGEFKRGKSSILNLLLGTPDLLPVADLPCTSAVTAVRYGDSLQFEQQNASRHWETRDVRSYRDAVSRAKEATRSGDQAEVPHWRVHAPSPLLRTAFLEIVDTPGVGEDEGRDRIAMAEANTADGALLILSAEQQITMREVQLVEALRHRQQNLLVIVNKADAVGSPAREVLRYVQRRLEDRGVSVPAARIVAFSARTQAGTLPDVLSTAELVEVVRDRVLSQSTARKYGVMASKVDRAVATIENEIDPSLQRWKRNLEDHERVRRQLDEASAEYAQASAGIKRAGTLIRDPEKPTRALVDALMAAMPSLLDRTAEYEAEWTSEALPLTSPKKHAQEVSEKLRARFLKVIEAWMKEQGATIVTQSVAALMNDVSKELAPLRRYLQGSLGITEEEATQRITRLEHDSLRDSIEVPIDTGDAAGVSLRVAMMTVISLVVGYVIADIILFYLTSVIAGFLNPVLLAAAALGAVAVYAIKGDDYVRSWIRSKILDKVREELLKPDNRQKLEPAVRNGLQKFMIDVANAFYERSRELMADVSYQNKRLQEQSEELTRRHGDPAWIRSQLDHHLKLAEQIRQGLVVLRQLHKEMNERGNARGMRPIKLASPPKR